MPCAAGWVPDITPSVWASAQEKIGGSVQPLPLSQGKMIAGRCFLERDFEYFMGAWVEKGNNVCLLGTRLKAGFLESWNQFFWRKGEYF